MAPKKKKDKYIAAAQKHAQKQNFEKAIKEYLNALEEDKKDARVALKLGDLCVRVKKPQDGIKYFRLAASNYSKDGFYPKANAVYKKVLAIDPSRYDVRLEMADLYHKLGLMSDAMTQFREALNHFESEGNQEKTLEIVRKMVEIDPQNISNRVKLAERYFKGGQRDQGYVEFNRAAEDLKAEAKWDELIRMYATIIKVDPTNAANYHGYGDALMEKGDLERAFQSYHQILKYTPNDAQAMEKVIKVSVRLKDTQNAVQYLKKVAAIYESQGNKEDAARCWKRVLKIEPSDEEAKAYVGEQASSPAIETEDAPVSRARQLEEDDDDGKIGLAPADDELASPQEKHEEEASSEPVAEAPAPSPPGGGQGLEPPSEEQIPGMLAEADVYIRYGLMDKAQNYVARILSAFPEHHGALRTEALIQKENGQVDEAAKGLLKAAKAASQAGDPDAARRCVEEILSFQPSNAQAQSMAAELGSGEEISLDVEDEAQTAPSAAAPEEPETFSMEVEEEEAEEEELVLETEEPAAPDDALDGIDEPFAFVEEAGDEQLQLVDDDDLAIQDAAQEEPTLEIEDEPAMEMKGESPEPPEPTLEIEEGERIEEVAAEETPAVQAAPSPALSELEKVKTSSETATVFEEIEDEEVEVEEIPSLESAVDAAQEALGETFKDDIREEELEIPADELEEVEVEAQPEPEMPPAPSNLDLDDEWGDVDEREDEAPPPVSATSDLSEIADAADEAWDEAMEEDEAPAAQPTAAEAHPVIGEVAQAAEDAFGEAFGDLTEGEFDLSSALEEWDEDQEEKPAAQEEISDVDDVSSIIQSFSERVQDQIGEDAGAHFDLGIAYKEMGLYGEAVNSFRSALKTGANTAECLNMIGLCFKDQNELAKAESIFREGLKNEDISEHESMLLKYELAAVLEEQSRFSEALDLIREIEQVNPQYRDIDKMVISLEERLGGPDEGPPPRRDKISYI